MLAIMTQFEGKVMRKKLIEVALPLEAINRESAREKSIRHGHPSTLHHEIITRFPCLGLLGEPGMGKTHAMQTQRSGINQKVEEEGGQTL
jgi:uncharacterized protein DUF1156